MKIIEKKALVLKNSCFVREKASLRFVCYTLHNHIFCVVVICFIGCVHVHDTVNPGLQKYLPL